MKYILITGGAGFIGSNLANFYASNYKIIVIDDLSMGNLTNLTQSDNILFIKGDVTDSDFMLNILSDYSFEYIFHLAAIASVADSIERPVETHQVNFESVLNLLELIRKYQGNLKKLVFSSSAAVYGDEPTFPKKEESAICPLTPYAIDKFAAERYVVDYYHLYDIPTAAVRFFNVYGINQNPQSPYSGVISILVDRYKKLKDGQPEVFTMFGDGSQSRDFVYIDDVVQALSLVAEKDDSLGNVYNIGTGTSTSLNELVEIADTILNVKLPVSYLPERSGDIKHSIADISKVKELGYKSAFSVNDGLLNYINHEFASYGKDKK